MEQEDNPELEAHLCHSIELYLREQIRSTRLQSKKAVNLDEEYPITASFFGIEESSRFKIDPATQGGQEDELLSTADLLEKLIQLKTLEKGVL